MLVTMAGRPLILDWEDENGPAIVCAWHLGSKAGNAIADVLSGDVNPSGRLTVTVPRNVGQIPIFYNHEKTGRPEGDVAPYRKYKSSYIDVVNAPLYPFGYGLSYGELKYSDLRLSSRRLKEGETLSVSVSLSNPSQYDRTETVQLYVRDLVASITRPVMELKGFRQVSVKAGETIQVSIPLNTCELGFYGSDLRYVV